MELLKNLIESFGPSGKETQTANLIVENIRPFVDEVKVDCIGNVIAKKKGIKNQKVMIAAHIDQVAFMVLDIEKNGFVRFASAAKNLQVNALLNRKVVFENGTTGIIIAVKK